MLLTRLRILTATLLLASAAAFAAGVALERHATGGERTENRSSVGRTAAGPGTTPPPAEATTSGDADNGVEGAPTPSEGAGSEASEGPIETHNESAESGSESGAEPAAESSAESGTGSGTESGTEHGAESRAETLLGINPESTGLVLVAALISVLLAGLVVTVSSALVPVVIAAAMVAFAALDVREIVHQQGESRPGLAVMATVVALLHLFAAGSAIAVGQGSKTRETAKVTS